MSIKTKIYLIFIAYLIFLIILGSSLYITAQGVVSSIEKSEISGEIVQKLFGLNILTNDYLLYQTQRAKKQWQAVYNSLGDIIEHKFASDRKITHTLTEEEAIILHELHDEYKRVWELFSKIIQESISQKLRDSLVSQLLIKSQNMVSKAFELSHLSQKTILNTQNRDNVLNSTFLTAMFILVLVGFYALIYSALTPLKILMKGIERIDKGDLEYRVNIKAKDEIGKLAAAFNEMAENRLKTETALQKNEERYRTVAEFTYDWEYWIDAEGQFKYVSPSCERITGYTVEEFLKNPDLMTKIIHPKDIDLVSRHYQDELMDSEPHSMEFRIVTKNGKERWVGHVCQSVYGKPGSKLGRRASNRDITDQKKAEEELKAYMCKLKAANKELEAFSYSVSHDLRAPLRAIDSFARILLEDHSDRLDQEGSRVLSVITSNVQKMGQLIDDLLAFSRLDRKEMKTSKVDMNQLTHELIDEFKSDLGERIVKFNVTVLPDSLGDRAMLREALLNLISNAVKFTGGKNSAIIDIHGSTDEDETIYAIKDNGAGFNMKYADKLFKVFQRLHSSKEFGGTGIGLALAQRIVKKHSGRIWAKGAVGKGATFYFSLPKKGESNE